MTNSSTPQNSSPTDPAQGVDPVMLVGRQHAADRLLQAQKLNSQVYLRGEAPPTRQQVSAVLHALADHSFITHLLSDEVRTLGADRANLGPEWEQAYAIGRFFQKMGDWAEDYSTD